VEAACLGLEHRPPPAALERSLAWRTAIHRGWQKAAWFYGRFGVSEGQFLHGVPTDEF
jgi:hypothetical protein